ncbi:hypothetical protein IJT10_08525 [bacterium]|nr:hypothetical protein [bacterium]
MPEIPAPIQQIIDICEKIRAREASPDELVERFAKAQQIVQFERASATRFSWDILWSNKVKELIGKINVEIDSQALALRDLEKAVAENNRFDIEKAGHDLKFSSQDLLSYMEELRTQADRQRRLSPYPIFDSFLKVANNVYSGNFSAEILTTFFPATANYVLRLQASIKRFAIFYGSSPLTDTAQRVFDNLEKGLALVDLFLHKGSKQSLQDGISILISTTLAMFNINADMAQIASNERKYAKHPLVEELYRAQMASLEGSNLTFMWQAINDSLQLQRTQVQTLLNHPLGTFFAFQKRNLAVGMVRIDELISLAKQNGLDSINLAELDNVLSNLDKLINNEFTKVNLEFKLTEGAPNFEELLLSVGLIADGKMEYESFQIILQNNLDNISEALNQLNGCVGQINSQDWELLSHCLESQAQGCQLLDQAVLNGDLDSLRDGWRLISSALPSARRIVKEMKGRIAEKSSSQKTVTCMRCGQSNPESARYCSKCNSVLMHMMQSGPVEYIDIEGGGEEGYALPANIAKLDKLVRSVESGRAGSRQVEETVGELLASADSYRKIYENKVRPAVERDGLSPNLVERFENAMYNYISGLENCLGYVSEPNIGFLYVGLETCDAAASEISEVQDELKNYF